MVKVIDTLETSVDRLYQARFPSQVHSQRSGVWKTLCQSWFEKYIPASSRVVEIAAGYCEFINNVRAETKIAIDINPDTRRHAGPDVDVHIVPADAMEERLPQASCDVAFMSNFLEHCRSRDQVLAVLRSTAAILKNGGRLLILGPNYRYAYKEYYDYFDHYLPLSEKAVVEALQLSGFAAEVVQPRTLPYSFRGRLPSWPWLVKLYLALPLAWPIFGKQFFIVARKLPAVGMQRIQAGARAA